MQFMPSNYYTACYILRELPLQYRLIVVNPSKNMLKMQ